MSCSKVIATKLVSDPCDEREGVYFSQEDLENLKKLPAGTKLYILSEEVPWDMYKAVSTVVSPYAAKLIWQRWMEYFSK